MEHLYCGHFGSSSLEYYYGKVCIMCPGGLFALCPGGGHKYLCSIVVDITNYYSVFRTADKNSRLSLRV